jgi:hypothetical protein
MQYPAESDSPPCYRSQIRVSQGGRAGYLTYRYRTLPNVLQRNFRIIQEKDTAFDYDE